MQKNKGIKICVIGTGYVGLVSGTCFAELGHNVICVDNNKEKVEKLKNGISPIYEPGLEQMILKNIKEGRISFTEDIESAVKKSDVIFIAVHTPTKDNGETDLRYVEAVSRQVATFMNGYKVIVSKSTMPVKTGQKIKEIISKMCPAKIKFDIVSNPEFLKEGTAINDFLSPDRIVIGVESKKAKIIMGQIYEKIKHPIIFTNIESAEIIKHSCNSFLATKISFINAIANICEKNSANIDEVVLAMGLDKRIGTEFLNPGIGFGGSCFPKDVAAFINVAEKNGYDFGLLKEVRKINQKQREYFLDKIIEMAGPLKNKNLGILGLSFKPNTDDMRSAPSIDIIKGLLGEGAKMKVFDPVAMEKAKEIFGNDVTYCNNMYDVAKDSDALIILTEWKEFSKINLAKLKRLLKKAIIIDGRNIFNPDKVKKSGFEYYSIGRP